MKNIVGLITFTVFLIGETVAQYSVWDKSSWNGNTSHFIWDQNSLQLNGNSSSSSSVYKKIDWSNSLKVSFSCHLFFSPSTSNQLSIDFGATDSLFLTPYYSIKIGESGSKDGPDLFYNSQKTGMAKTRNMGQGGTCNFELEFANDSLHIKIRDDINGNTFSIPFHSQSTYFRLSSKYTSSNSKKFTYYNYQEQLSMTDTTPPYLEKIITTDHSIHFFFNEKCIPSSPQMSPQPDSMEQTYNSITFFFQEELKDGWISLTDTIKDQLGNSRYVDTAFQYNRIDPYDLIITEILADPFPTVSIYDKEFIEIYNNSQFNISLLDLKILINNSLTSLPDTVLLPNHYYLFYPASINNAGCTISIMNQEEIIHKVNYNPSAHTNEFKRNGGWSLELIDYNKPCVEQHNWKSSIHISGATPNELNSVADEIEILDSLKITNVFPLNPSQLLLEFNYPPLQDNQLINSLSSSNVAFLSIQLSSDSILLFCDALDSLTTYYIKMEESLQTCFDLPSNTIDTIKFGLPSSAEENDLLINEVLFNPSENGADYIEIKNASSKIINLHNYYLSSRNNQSELSDFHLISPVNQLLMPNEILAISPQKSWVETQYPHHGKIIEQKIPSCNIKEDYIAIVNQSAKILNQLTYSENMHFEGLTSQKNVSLERVNDQINSPWFSASSLYNFGTPGLRNSQEITTNATANRFEILNDIITPNLDGIDDLLIIYNQFKEPGWWATMKIYDVTGMTIHTLLKDELLSTENTITWDCTTTNNATLPAGIYTLLIEYIHKSQSDRKKEKITFYINR